MSTRTRVRVVRAERIGDVPGAAWDALVGPDEFYLSHAWLGTVERDRVARACYLVASDERGLVGALPVYRQVFEDSRDYRAGRFRELLGIEGAFLVAGGRLGNRHGLALAPDLRPAQRDETARELLEAAREVATEEGLAGVVLPYLPTVALERVGRVSRVTAAFDEDEAILVGASAGVAAVVAGWPRKRRYAARQERAMFAESAWSIRAEPLRDCAAEVAELVSQVNGHHGYVVPSFLLRRVFRWQGNALGGDAVALTCRGADGWLVACAVEFRWRDGLYLHAVGLDYASLGSYEYFNVMVYRAIEYAAEHRLDRLHLGLATPAKTLRGAVRSPLWTAALLADSADQPAGITWRGCGTTADLDRCPALIRS